MEGHYIISQLCWCQLKAEKHVSRPKQCQYLIYIYVIYDNLYQYQPMMSPVAADID